MLIVLPEGLVCTCIGLPEAFRNQCRNGHIAWTPHLHRQVAEVLMREDAYRSARSGRSWSTGDIGLRYVSPP